MKFYVRLLFSCLLLGEQSKELGVFHLGRMMMYSFGLSPANVHTSYLAR